MKRRVRELTALVMAVCMICGGIWFAKSAAYAAEVADTYTLTWKDYPFGEPTYTPIEYNKEPLAAGAAITLPKNDPTKPGYIFLGWCGYGGGFDGTNSMLWDYGDNYKQSDSENFKIVMASKDVSIYAYWSPIEYRIQFVGGAEDVVTGLPGLIEDIDGVSIYYQDDITLPTETPTRDNYQFAGWNYDGTIYSPGGTFTVPDAPTDVIIDGVATLTLTLTAVWANSSGSVIGAGQHYLMQSSPYTLSGATKVEGDTGQYTDGITFYVPSNGYYTFSQ